MDATGRYLHKAARLRREKARMIPGWELDYFNSKEWLDVQDRLDDFDARAIVYNPVRSSLFRALERCSFDSTNVAFIGQDPYPDPKDATGVAFSASVSPGTGQDNLHLPGTLKTIYTEYVRDLGYTYPSHGCLEKWCDQGVLLWNAIPIYTPTKMGEFTINAFTKWSSLKPLTIEIIERLSAKGKIIFVFCGHKAQEYANFVDIYNNQIIYVSHPSPRGQINANDKFIGSRVFTTINAKLNQYLKEPIDWRLD